ncbi:hypothetical protein F5X99DRAFT_356742 [Biscogniauxia marginata]|nr:hypothetical protein F5X99DRAFT_356742 [Biscogniauxia marginata]
MPVPADVPSHEPISPSDHNRLAALWKRFMGKDHTSTSSTTYVQDPGLSRDTSPSSGLIRRVSRKVVPGLPRVKTFKRQQSEGRDKLEPIKPTQAERRAVSVDRRLHPQRNGSNSSHPLPLPRASAPDFLDDVQSVGPPAVVSSITAAPQSPIDEKQFLSLDEIGSTTEDTDRPDSFEQVPSYTEALSTADIQSETTSQYEAMIHDELEKKWILNLSMHFRDKSKREKFFVTYREREYLWRRVTISLDYRNAPDDSLERDLLAIKFQREKSAKIYEAIRESLQDIQFYDTVTNLKLQTTDGRLHVHVVEDVTEIISYPTVRMIQHLKCRRIRERDIEFDSHMSGFVYKVRVAGQTLIKKEIPGPDTIDEFLYEVNALNSLKFSRNIIEFFGVVVDDDDQSVKGLLISYAEQGALIDIIYDTQEGNGDLPWAVRQKWARQIVQGLSDIHEAGFVQGDFTLSNIVIDDDENAKIIDINRRGCPVGWEPPEATPLIESNQRISMYIGVKSDLYQLGMVLWALATLEDEPEAHGRPLRLDPEIEVPPWYRNMVESCLHDNPRGRPQATALLAMFPEYDDELDRQDLPSISIDDGYSLQEYVTGGRGGRSQSIVEPRNNWPYAPGSNTQVLSPNSYFDDIDYYPPRGRSPPHPLPSNNGPYHTRYNMHNMIWSDNDLGPSANSAAQDEARAETPRDDNQAAALMDQMDQDLKELEEEDINADLDHGRAQTAGSKSQAEITSRVPFENFGHREKPPSPINDSIKAIAPINESTPTRSSDDSNKTEYAEKASASNDQTGTTAPSGGSYQGGLPDKTAKHTLRQGEYEENDAAHNYTHNRGGDRPVRRRTATSPPTADGSSQGIPPPELPPELSGIGSAHEKQVEYRQPIYSDEDLCHTRTATQDVTYPV